MQIRIPEPCTENWDIMSPKEKGRHCSKCDKVVVDFTGFTDHRIVEYFKEHTNVCGRFNNFQMNREIQALPAANPWQQWLRKAAVSSFLFTKAFTDKAEAQPLPQDSITKVQTFLISRSIHATINQPDSMPHKAVSLKFGLGDFNLFLPLDSNQYTFSLPDTFTSGIIAVELATADSTYHFQINTDRFTYYGNQLDVSFNYSNGTWAWNIWNLTYRDMFPQIVTQGIISPYQFQKFEIDTSSFRWGWAMPIIDTFKMVHVKEDSIHLLGDVYTNEDTTYYSESAKKKLSEKRKSSPLWWLIPSFILIPIISWQIRKRLKNKPTEE